jgi:hypothetical protein
LDSAWSTSLLWNLTWIHASYEPPLFDNRQQSSLIIMCLDFLL